MFHSIGRLRRDSTGDRRKATKFPSNDVIMYKNTRSLDQYNSIVSWHAGRLATVFAHLGPILLTMFNLNVSVDKLLHSS